MKKTVSILILFSFLLNCVMPQAVAQGVFLPPAQGTVSLSPAFTPCQLRGVKIDPQDPFRLDFIVEEGDSGLRGQAFEEESQKLIKYFLATLTTPEKDLWVNLSPYEDNRIIQDDFGRTAMGRDLLSQDYVLKQITASLMHPDADLGKKFWAEVYKRTFEKYGTTDIPVDTFNKVWIVPERAVIYESSGQGSGVSGQRNDNNTSDHRPLTADHSSLAAFVDEAKLKVMLESDYLAQNEGRKDERTIDEAGRSSIVPRPSSNGDTQNLAKQVVRDVIVPVLEREINEGKNFAQLRQVYHSLLLAVWLKKKLQSAAPPEPVAEKPGFLKGNLLSMIFVNQHKTGGLETADPKAEVRSIYDRYVEAFKKGAYNLIREDYDLYSQELIPRKYFSGGVEFSMRSLDAAMRTGEGLPNKILGLWKRLQVRLEPEGASTGLYVEDTRQGPVYYFQTTKRKALKALSAIVLAGTIGSYSAGYFLGRHMALDQLQSQPPAVVQVVEQPDRLETKDVEDIIDAVTYGYQMYTTGVLHDKKKVSEDRRATLMTPLQSREDVFASISTDDNRHLVNAGWLKDFFNDRYEKFGGDLRKAGIFSKKEFAHLLSMMEIESNLQVDKSNKISRGLLQFERPSWRFLIKTTDNLSSDLAKIVEKARNEDARRLGRGARWESQSPSDAVVQTKDHITMAIYWLNLLMSQQPDPVELEYNRLDGVLLDKVESQDRDGLSGMPMTIIPLVESWARLKEKYPKDDPLRMLFLIQSLKWNQGPNNSDEQLGLYYSYIKSGPEERKAFQQKAASDVKKFITARGIAVKRIGAMRRDIFTDQLKRNLISVDAKLRLKALLTLAPKLAGREKEKAEFIAAWKAFRNAEAGLSESNWRMGPCVRGAAYALKSVALWEDADEAYELGLSYRNVYSSTKAAQSVVDKAKREHFKSLFQGRPGPAVKAPKNNSLRPKIIRKTPDRAMSSTTDTEATYGGIDLETGRMDLIIRGNAGAFEVEIPADKLEQLRSDVRGFVPLIINVEPLRSLPAFLGLADSAAKAKG